MHYNSTTMKESQAATSAQDFQGSLDLGCQVFSTRRIHSGLASAALVEASLARAEATLAESGALVAYTGVCTGRSPKDRYIVAEPRSKDSICWGPINRPMEPGIFDRLLSKVQAYLRERELFIFDGGACADPRHRLKIRVIAEKAWHSLFAQCLFLRTGPGASEPHTPSDLGTLTILHAADLHASPATDGTRSEVFIALNLDRRLVLIGGTHYAGEIKKAVFSVLNYLLPQRGVFPMHCSANIGQDGSTALFFGLSGTGKTSLSADPHRRLIGDDEHGWSEEGVFNLEGGCYAKTIRLSREDEPQIWKAIRFGSVLENVVLHPRTRIPDYDDERITENTRAAYPVHFIDNCELSGRGGHPASILFLTCDAFGVLPPVSKLTPDQAMYHFLSGYTAKVAGTEAGVTEPEATFSTCFAAPFLPLHPTRYVELLQQRLQRYRVPVWLVNTGWSGGPYGVGRRIELRLTRAMVHAILDGRLAEAAFAPDPIFGMLVPRECPGVPAAVLQPRNTWKNPRAYEESARKLAGLFRENFQQYTPHVSEAVRQAGPG